MNKYIKQWCFAVFMLSLSSVALAAPKGICTPDNGVFHSTLDFSGGNDSNLLIVFYVQIMPDGLVMQLHRF
ncbi:long polar fimbrial operon protein LpfD [Shigella flexneri]|nr:long polar fimbrial operon protein LpfD [Shigella flexneri]